MKKKNFLFYIFIFTIIFVSNSAYSQEYASIEMFTPQGVAKGVRQAVVRFSEQMVAFGDPRISDPFEVKCSVNGKGRWIDERNWSYDFDKDLPAGIVCEFTLKKDVKTLSGKEIKGKRTFSFSTGGPAIIKSYPYGGNEYLDENQIFILTLDTTANEESVISNLHFSIEGINEKVKAVVIKGNDRKAVLKASGYVADNKTPRILIKSNRTFPNNSKVQLVWGKGIKSVSGVATEKDQTLSFKTREPFTAKFTCSRENPNKGCIPMLPFTLSFSSPVSQEYVKKVYLKDSNNKVYRPSFTEDDKKEKFVNYVTFKGLFPENTVFTLHIPKEIKDDAYRSLANINRFPLTVRTESYPPLAKFAARFGIIELKGDAALPVTLRNLEAEVNTKMLQVEAKKGGTKGETIKEKLLEKAVKLGESITKVLPEKMQKESKEFVEGLKGKLYKTAMDKEEKIIEWFRIIEKAKRSKSILKDVKEAATFSVPKPGGSKAFEVVGIPLKKAGFYIVEMESRILGEALLAKKEPIYVSTAALVTNLSAHFKWGRESSLVWVTTLDRGEPVSGASVTVRDCSGKILWKGKTNLSGIAVIKKKLPKHNQLPVCKYDRSKGYDRYDDYYSTVGDSGLFIFAKTYDDITFVHSSWDNGIEAWRYKLPEPSYTGPAIVHTIFDRTLLRGGETVHMKHIFRKQSMYGFELPAASELPKFAKIKHSGSSQSYEFPLKWNIKNGAAETVWKIPKEAKLGLYRVSLIKEASKKVKKGINDEESDDDYDYYNPANLYSGSFRVEEYRVPLMRGIIKPLSDFLVNVSELDVDLIVTYLSGGGAGNADVKLRSQVKPMSVSFENYDDFIFANGGVKEEVIKSSRHREYYDLEEDAYEAEESVQQPKKKTSGVQSGSLILDSAGSLRTKITNIPKITSPQNIITELEFKDPNGEIQTVSKRIPIYPSKILAGIALDSWASSKEQFKFKVVVLDIKGKPVPNINVKVDIFQRKSYSHRKRLIGGFYSYEHISETKLIGKLLEGKTDFKGLLIGEVKSPVTGNAIIQATVVDDAGNVSKAHTDVWIAGKGEWWFDVTDNDRIDLLPEKKKYKPGDVAKFQVRMPFRKSTALVTVEREGIIDYFIKTISGKNPVIQVPVKKSYAPNVFISVLCIRGRVGGIKPTALVDLGKPAYKLGISEIKVGWDAHELKVNLSSNKEVYKVREKAVVKIKVKKADGKALPKGSEVAIAAVDEGLLELMPNASWNLLEAMMKPRGYEVTTSTAQMHVVGKRHFGLKAIPHGGGGGRQVTRELFDTLLLWKSQVTLNGNGEATVEIPLNDSLTAFKIVAVANGGTGLFGTGATTIRTTQDLMLLPGIPPLVREGDKFKGGVTVRNTSTRKMNLEIRASLNNKELEIINESLTAGEAKDISWDITVPYNLETLNWEIAAVEKNGDASDRLKTKQKVAPLVPVRTFQATITQVENSFSIDVKKPSDAILNKGGINVLLKPRLSTALGGVIEYMKNYPYVCLEQKISRAVALRDEAFWKQIMAELPSYLDSDGFAKYFPSMKMGSDVITSYILSISNEAGWTIPKHSKEMMENALLYFIEGKVIRGSVVPTADLTIRKIGALEALSRSNPVIGSKLLSSISIQPNLWPTSAVLDWFNILLRVKDIPKRDEKLKEAEQILRSRLNIQGTTAGFSTERTDGLWWLMISPDLNVVKTILTALNLDSWKPDMPRLVIGAIGRQKKGRWNTTIANAWGVLAIEKFSKKFEAVPVDGTTKVTVKNKMKSLLWAKSREGGKITFGWHNDKENLSIKHQGSGKPWATIQSLAAIPLKEPFSSGYKIKKTLIPVNQKHKGKWSMGDVIRIKLELEAQSDMTWVVVNDPVPAGSSILGSGLGRDSELLTKGEKRKGWVWPAFEERSFEAFRAYYEYVPKGKWSFEYTIRLNNEGVFLLPETRVEALYAPEMFGEIPNKKMAVGR